MKVALVPAGDVPPQFDARLKSVEPEFQVTEAACAESPTARNGTVERSGVSALRERAVLIRLMDLFVRRLEAADGLIFMGSLGVGPEFDEGTIGF